MLMFTGGSEAPKQSFSDGLMEVFCLASSLHIAQLQVGLGEPIRLGQCSSLKVSCDNECSSHDNATSGLLIIFILGILHECVGSIVCWLKESHKWLIKQNAVLG